MRATLLIIFLLLISLSTAASTAPRMNNPSPSSNPAQITNRIIVKFSDNAGMKLKTGADGVVSFGQAAADKINRRYRITSVRPLINIGQSAVSAKRFKNIVLVTVPGDADPNAILSEYAAVPGVEYAEPEYTAELHVLSNDKYQSHQWGLSNEGQGHYYIIRNPGIEDDKMVIINGLPGADIGRDDVIGNPPDNTVTTVVAIIDTGVDTDHPDLAANMWINPGEIENNGIDDDHNGYVDDIFGWDFSPSSESYDIDEGDNDPTDYFGHGTHCAGIVAAVGNNGIGIMGTAPDTKIMALKIFPSSLTSKMALAVIYAADNGADVSDVVLPSYRRAGFYGKTYAYIRQQHTVFVFLRGFFKKLPARHTYHSDGDIFLSEALLGFKGNMNFRSCGNQDNIGFALAIRQNIRSVCKTVFFSVPIYYRKFLAA